MVGSSVYSQTPEALAVTAPRNSAGSPKPVASGSAIQTPTQVTGQACPLTVSSVPLSAAVSITGRPMPRFPKVTSLPHCNAVGSAGPSPVVPDSRSTARPSLSCQLLTRMECSRFSWVLEGWLRRMPSPSLKAIVLASATVRPPINHSSVSPPPPVVSRMPSPPLPRSKVPVGSVPIELAWKVWS